MKFDGIKKVSEGRFINRYDLYYTTEDDKKKVYEIISRNKDIKTIEDIRNEKTDGVVIVATDESDEHILINKEYRMSVGDYVYNFPREFFYIMEERLDSSSPQPCQRRGGEVVR